MAGEGDRCYACFNRETANRLGVAFDNTPQQPIIVTDADGMTHTFEIRSMLVPTGHAMEALEVERDRNEGYRFGSVLALGPSSGAARLAPLIATGHESLPAALA